MASLQEVINQTSYWKDFLPVASHKIISLIQACHTARLGYHHMQCTNEQCNHSYYQYHSCGNRHCPACGSGKAREWMQQRMGKLLPVKYFHVVLTLPFELRPLVALNRRLLFKTLFDAAAYCPMVLCAYAIMGCWATTNATTPSMPYCKKWECHNIPLRCKSHVRLNCSHSIAALGTIAPCATALSPCWFLLPGDR
jgi:hypothetical protein